MKTLRRLSLAIALSATSAWAGNTAAEPMIKQGYEPWMSRHLEFVETAKTSPNCQVLFLGDSITDYWRTKALDIWNENFAPLGAVNFGMAGDRTQHLLWRLQNGEIGSLKPKAIVLMIGTNNIGLEKDKKTIRNTTEEIAGGIKANIDYLRARFPDAKILLLGVFPRGAKDSPARKQVADINQLISKFADGQHVYYLDIGDKFLASDGSIPKKVMPEMLHPTKAGYQIWADAIKQPLADLLK
jgi:lysophospholipase L1-like esterase